MYDTDLPISAMLIRQVHNEDWSGTPLILNFIFIEEVGAFTVSSGNNTPQMIIIDCMLACNLSLITSLMGICSGSFHNVLIVRDRNN